MLEILSNRFSIRIVNRLNKLQYNMNKIKFKFFFKFTGNREFKNSFHLLILKSNDKKIHSKVGNTKMSNVIHTYTRYQKVTSISR